MVTDRIQIVNRGVVIISDFPEGYRGDRSHLDAFPQSRRGRIGMTGFGLSGACWLAPNAMNMTRVLTPLNVMCRTMGATIDPVLW